MATVATLPTYPVTGRKTRVVFTIAGVGANYIRVWCTVAPNGSALGNQLAALGAATHRRIQVYEGTGGSAAPLFRTFDKGGLYTLKSQEYTKVGGPGTFSGGYLGDERGAPSETKVGSEDTLTLTVGDKLLHKLGAGRDTADLTLWSFNSTIRATTVVTHGATTPEIVNPTSERARIAMGESAVRSYVATLKNSVLGTLIGGDGLVGCLQDLQACFDTHLTYAGRHNASDSDNTIGTELVTNVSPDGFPAALAMVARKVYLHLTNDNGDGVGSAAYHRVSSNDRIDWLNVPIMMSCGPAEVLNMLGDLFRVIYNHAGGNGAPSTQIHGNNTTTGQLPGATTRLAVSLQAAFFDALAKNTPTAASGQGGLAASLSNYGFRPG